ncbi:MAG: transposase, partial [Pseudomonadota bacterium]
SVRAHLAGKDDGLVTVAPVLKRTGDFADFLKAATASEREAAFKRLRQGESTGRPIGGEDWLKNLEDQTGRLLRPQKRGPKGRRRKKK